MKCLVTGGAGFIGSHLVDRLLQDGHQVVVLDNFINGRPENLAQHHGSPSLSLQQVDITDYESVPPHFRSVDWVFHLAALADVVPSIKRPLDYHRTNVDGTFNVLEAARLAGVKRFIYTASASCYGISDITPTPETAEVRPEYPYALSKYLGEQYVLHWGKVYQVPVLSLRLFNVYGPRSRTSGTYGAVFGVFLAQKLKNKPFTVVGDGTQRRDFIFVTDVANTLVMAAESNISHEVINAGSGQAHSVNYLVELLGGDVVYIPKRPGEPDCTQADISKIKKRLGWKPDVSFEEGVKIILEHIDWWREAPIWTPETIGEAAAEWFKYLSDKKVP
ncbi:MAG: SDR family oxidoreductase [Dehalococcoidales bacterium]|jgi:UDP-glucose 4-epimerase|nr:SDR family oxidoreductase [Dehalococcoidales bacterium]MDP7285687.1 SDR family oxidoreductase [Dehalococcoidales bacterium]